MSIYQFKEDDAYRFAREQGIKVRKHGNELQFRECPYCHGKGKYGFDKETFAINLSTGQFQCLREKCGVKGNMITLAKEFGFSLGRDVDEYINSKRQFRDLRKYGRPVTKDPAVAYMESRGISRETTEMYSITTKEGQDNILAFPFFDHDGVLQFVKYRKTDFDKEKDSNKEWCMSNCKPILFGMDQCSALESKTLVMTEGQIDSMSVAEAFDGMVNAVSVPTGAKGFTWVPYCWDFLTEYEELIIFGDCENGSITLLEEMKGRFPGVVRHVREEDYLGCKDANEILMKHGKAAVIHAAENAVMVGISQISRLADVERRDLSRLPSVKTGLPSLDKLTGGLFFGSLAIITGERGNGKSTLALEFITRAIAQGYPAFIYSGELMNWIVQDWIDRLVVGADHIRTLESNLGYVTHTVQNSVIEQAHEWYKDLCYLYDVDSAMRDGADDHEGLIGILEKAIQMYGCRVLLIDNLMTAMVDDLQSDLYRQQGAFVRKLSIMAKRFDVLIILVAHPRKRTTNDFTNDDILGSGSITNLADTIIRYDKPKETGDSNLPDRILQVTKNRLNGKTHNGIALYFDARSKRISEDPTGFGWDLGWKSGEEGFELLEDMDTFPF